MRGELIRTKPAIVVGNPNLQVPLQLVEVLLLGSKQGRLLVLADHHLMRPFLGDRNVPARTLPETVGVFFAVVGDCRGVFFLYSVVKELG